MNPDATKPSNPVLIGIDWGSSNLRAALLDAQGKLIGRRESSEGVFTLNDGAFGSVLFGLCGDWISEHRVPVLACGMIGSKQGAVEVPYVACPAGMNELAPHLGSVALQGGSTSTGSQAINLFIVPGLKTGSAASGWDVVRGEETQLLGIQAAPGSLHILPGTHSKWMTIGSNGCIDSFQTYMTGELFELLRKHSSLARVMSESNWSPDAFQQGVNEASNGDLENLLFRVRTAGLMERFPAAALADYLSGMLIGAEIKAGLHRFTERDPKRPISVLGSAQLTQRYAAALTSFGFRASEIPGNAVFDGLLSVARAAGLVPPLPTHV